MLYRNIKTGAEFNSLCPISGENWVPVKEPEPQVAVDETETLDEVDYDEVTKKEIMRELDAWDIEYNPKMTKRELYNLMTGG